MQIENKAITVEIRRKLIGCFRSDVQRAMQSYQEQLQRALYAQAYCSIPNQNQYKRTLILLTKPRGIKK